MSAADVTPDRLAVVRDLIRHELPGTAREIVLDSWDALSADAIESMTRALRTSAQVPAQRGEG